MNNRPRAWESRVQGSAIIDNATHTNKKKKRIMQDITEHEGKRGRSKGTIDRDRRLCADANQGHLSLLEDTLPRS
jgi:hypothetical protein